MAKKELVKCMDCKKATILQYSKYDPLISLCSKDGQRDVANSNRVCADHEKDNKPKVIHKQYGNE